MSDKPECSGCRYWLHRGNGYGECMRHPPLAKDPLAMYPVTGEGWWCGEWQDRANYSVTAAWLFGTGVKP